MLRQVAIASFAASTALCAHADEFCIACDAPAATYRCAIEQPSEKFKIGAALGQEMCAKVMAKKGPHENCHAAALPDGSACDGGERTVTVTDYQRAIAGTDESTYEVGAFEIARQNVHDTWRCVLSMFKDC